MTLPIGLAIAGTVISTMSAVNAAKYNANTLNQQAKLEEQQAQIAENQQREVNRRFLARQRATVGAMGVLTEGSPLEVMTESAKQAEMEALNIRYQGQLGAYGYRRQAALEEAKIFPTLLSGGLGIGQAWYASKYPKYQYP